MALPICLRHLEKPVVHTRPIFNRTQELGIEPRCSVLETDVLAVTPFPLMVAAVGLEPTYPRL